MGDAPRPGADPTLVLLPGLDGTGEMFEPFSRELPGRFTTQIIRYPTEGPQDYATLAAYVLGQLPTDRLFVLLGESFSGPVAVLAAAEQPPGLVGVILCASFVASPRPAASALAGLASVMPLHAISRLSSPLLLMGGTGAPGLAHRLARSLADVPQAVLSARCRAVAKVDVREPFRALALPLLYLRARRDLLVPRSAGDEFIRLQPRARLEDVDGPHFLLQCAPVVAARVVTDFVTHLSSRDASKAATDTSDGLAV